MAAAISFALGYILMQAAPESREEQQLNRTITPVAVGNVRPGTHHKLGGEQTSPA